MAPQGTLFGKNTTAGLVVVTSNQADPEETELKYRGSVKAGDYDLLDVRMAVDIPIVADKLAMTLAGLSKSDGGYYDVVVPGGEDGSQDRTALHLGLAWKATEALTGSFMYDHSEIDAESTPSRNFSTPDKLHAGFSGLLSHIAKSLHTRSDFTDLFW